MSLPAGVERRSTDLDGAKFSTQRAVTYVLLGVFIGVTITVLYQNDQSERSMILQTVINLTLLAVGFWLGASKQGQDQAHSMQRIAESAPAVAAAVVANAAQPTPPKADEVIVQTENTTVIEQERKP